MQAESPSNFKKNVAKRGAGAGKSEQEDGREHAAEIASKLCQECSENGARRLQNRAKMAPGGSRRPPQEPNSTRKPFFFAPFFGLLGGCSWGAPGGSWGRLGASWAAPGVSWGAPGAHFGLPGSSFCSFLDFFWQHRWKNVKTTKSADSTALFKVF